MYGCVPVQTLTILEVNQASDGLIDLAMSMEDFISHDPTKTGIVHGFLGGMEAALNPGV